MSIFLLIVVALIGTVIGAYAKVWILLTITGLCAAFGLWMKSKIEGLEVIALAVYLGFAFAGNLAMWITFFFTTQPTPIKEVLHQYLLR